MMAGAGGRMSAGMGGGGGGMYDIGTALNFPNPFNPHHQYAFNMQNTTNAVSRGRFPIFL